MLTCGHNAFDIHQTKQEFDQIFFTPSPDYLEVDAKYKVKNVYYHRKFKESDLKNNRANDYFFIYDFALMELDTTDNLEQIYGSIGYDFGWIPKDIK